MRRIKAPFEAFAALVLRPMLAALMLLAALDTAQAAPRTIMVFGDSLMAGLGLPAGDGLVPRLEAALRADGLDVTLINASVSGDTSADGLARLDWALAERPDAVILELGANDMLRGLPVTDLRANLSALLERCKAENLPVFIAGIYANRSLGDDYVAAFEATYAELAAQYGAPLYPFLLDGVALDPALNQPDMLHPNADGVGVIVSRLAPVAAEWLRGLK
jgi:acyl-CoA thioesterase-1